MRTTAAIALAATLLAGCSFTERITERFWGGGPREASRLPAGAEQYRCDANRTLVVRMEGAESAWLFFPDREFRLDAVPGAAGARYSNGRSSLLVKGDALFVEEGSSVTHANCKRG